jgi:hypothetical protein
MVSLYTSYVIATQSLLFTNGFRYRLTTSIRTFPITVQTVRYLFDVLSRPPLHRSYSFRSSLICTLVQNLNSGDCKEWPGRDLTKQWRFTFITGFTSKHSDRSVSVIDPRSSAPPLRSSVHRHIFTECDSCMKFQPTFTVDLSCAGPWRQVLQDVLATSRSRRPLNALSWRVLGLRNPSIPAGRFQSWTTIL